MRDRDNKRDDDSLEKSHHDRGRPLHEDYSERQDRRPVFDDVTDTLKPPSRRDHDGGNNR